jgi:acyl carrier protein
MPDAADPGVGSRPQGFEGDSIEAAVVGVWCEVLGIASVLPDDAFLAVGGDSLGIMRVLSRLNQRFGTALSPETVFDLATPREQAMAIRRLLAPGATAPPSGRG